MKRYLGTNFFRDFFAKVRDVVGGRSGAYEKELARARETAFREIQEEALEVGANAIVGIDLDYEVMGENGKHVDGEYQWDGGDDHLIVDLTASVSGW